MRGDVKGYRVGRKSQGDCRDKCGALNLRADNPVDAALLAMLGRMLFGGATKCDNARMDLYLWMRQQMPDPESFPGPV